MKNITSILSLIAVFSDMILSKISQMFWCGALVLAVCVPAVRAQENTGTAESVPASETASSEPEAGIDLDAVLKAAEAGDAEAQFRLYLHYALSGTGDEEKSLKWLIRAAESEHADAQNILAARYMREHRIEDALKWWEKAAGNGHPVAQFWFGRYLATGIEDCLEADVPRALDLISESAIAGYESAQIWLGNEYCDGEFVEQNYELAATWYRAAAERGNAEAQFSLAQAYYTGLGVDKNAVEYSAWLRKAAENGHAEAQGYLAYDYFIGNIVEQNYEKAAEWWAKSAEQGEPRAQHSLAQCYRDGTGVPADKAKALEWFRKAAEQNHAGAQMALAVAYRDGDGVPADMTEGLRWMIRAHVHGYENAREEFWAPLLNDMEAAFKNLERAAESGETAAQKALGEIYCLGRGVPADEEKAIAWYRRAAEQGDAEAQKELAIIYWNRGDAEDALPWAQKAAAQGDGEGECILGLYYLKKGDILGIEYLKKSAEQGEPFAQWRLGVCYYNGECVPVDSEEAVRWFSLAAESGFPDAFFSLGCAYEAGKGVEKDLARAAEMYEQAAYRGNAEAQFRLGRCYADGIGVAPDPECSAKWYEKSAEGGHLRGQLQAGFICLSGDVGPVRTEDGLEWIERSAKGGWWLAQGALFDIYYFGRYGIEVDKEKGIYWLRQLAETEPDDNDSDKIPTERAGVYRSMYGTFWEDEGKPEEAAKWFEKSAALGHPSGQYDLGRLYFHGNGVPEDKAKAVELFRLAAEQGYDRAQYNLGICYFRGIGVPKSIDEAVRWMQKAAEQGDEKAQQFLKDFEADSAKGKENDKE
ncbi:MAG: SEL1-like repeat protein [Verrucomicrobia bacterium]|nr:SEL1-like repeat protein [Verrucomicrobiota bacterium]